MKPIPKELRAYFPAVVDDARPWWHVRGVNPGSVKWARNDGPVTYSDVRPEEWGKIDRADPMPPPPILVGQVWACRSESGTYLWVNTVGGVVYGDGSVTVYWVASCPIDDGADLIAHGVLLTCPFGYAPWSGPEVP